MKIIDKIFGLQDSQIEKWGKFSGSLNLLIGAAIFLYSPYFFFTYRDSIVEYAKSKLVGIAEHDQELVQELYEIITAADGAITYIMMLFLATSILFIHNGLMQLKLYKLIKKQA